MVCTRLVQDLLQHRLKFSVSTRADRNHLPGETLWASPPSFSAEFLTSRSTTRRTLSLSCSPSQALALQAPSAAQTSAPCAQLCSAWSAAPRVRVHRVVVLQSSKNERRKHLARLNNIPYGCQCALLPTCRSMRVRICIGRMVWEYIGTSFIQPQMTCCSINGYGD